VYLSVSSKVIKKCLRHCNKQIFNEVVFKFFLSSNNIKYTFLPNFCFVLRLASLFVCCRSRLRLLINNRYGNSVLKTLMEMANVELKSTIWLRTQKITPNIRCRASPLSFYGVDHCDVGGNEHIQRGRFSQQDIEGWMSICQ